MTRRLFQTAGSMAALYLIALALSAACWTMPGAAAASSEHHHPEPGMHALLCAWSCQATAHSVAATPPLDAVRLTFVVADSAPVFVQPVVPDRSILTSRGPPSDSLLVPTHQ